MPARHGGTLKNGTKFMAKLNFEFADNNKTVKAKVGDTFVITLPENATTGFQWNVASFTEPTVAVEARGARPAASTTMGAGGSAAIFQFRATAIGRGNITLMLSRGGKIDPSAVKYNLELDIY